LILKSKRQQRRGPLSSRLRPRRRAVIRGARKSQRGSDPFVVRKPAKRSLLRTRSFAAGSVFG
jgi:hypothetical protein